MSKIRFFDFVASKPLASRTVSKGPRVISRLDPSRVVFALPDLPSRTTTPEEEPVCTVSKENPKTHELSDSAKTVFLHLQGRILRLDLLQVVILG